MKQTTGIIYKWTNTINNKSYIGQTINEKSRYNSHLKSKDNSHFHCALRKYGKDAFIYEVLESDIPVELLNEREIFWISFYNSYKNGYNSSAGGCQGTTYSDEARKHMSEARKGIRYSEETKRKIGEASKGRVIILSDEAKVKISKALKGRTSPMKGKHHSEEGKRNISNSQKGKTIPEEQRIKISNTLTGRKQPKEAVEKRAKSLRGKTIKLKGRHWKIVDGKRVWY